MNLSIVDLGKKQERKKSGAIVLSNNCLSYVCIKYCFLQIKSQMYPKGLSGPTHMGPMNLGCRIQLGPYGFPPMTGFNTILWDRFVTQNEAHKEPIYRTHGDIMGYMGYMGLSIIWAI